MFYAPPEPNDNKAGLPGLHEVVSVEVGGSERRQRIRRDTYLLLDFEKNVPAKNP
jgi:hypothetical protein